MDEDEIIYKYLKEIRNKITEKYGVGREINKGKQAELMQGYL